MAVSINKPTVGSDPNAWGDKINTALDVLAAGVNASAPAASPALTGNPTIDGRSAVAAVTDAFGGIHLYANGVEL